MKCSLKVSRLGFFPYPCAVGFQSFRTRWYVGILLSSCQMSINMQHLPLGTCENVLSWGHSVQHKVTMNLPSPVALKHTRFDDAQKSHSNPELPVVSSAPSPSMPSQHFYFTLQHLHTICNYIIIYLITAPPSDQMLSCTWAGTKSLSVTNVHGVPDQQSCILEKHFCPWKYFKDINPRVNCTLPFSSWRYIKKIQFGG